MGGTNYDENLPTLQDLYHMAYERRKEQVNYIWETNKFTITIISGINTATILLFGNTNSVVVAILPIFGVFIGYYSIRNMRRQYRRFLEIITWINKIEEVAGFHEEVNDNMRFYRLEKHLVPERWLEKFDTGENFITQNLSLKRRNMYGDFSRLLILMILLSLALSISIAIIYFAK